MQEHFDQQEKNQIVIEKRLELRQEDILQKERDLTTDKEHLMEQKTKLDDYPLSCLKNNHLVVDYINELYKELDKKLDTNAEPGSASQSIMNSVDGLSPHTAESRENLSFLQFLNNDRNRSILQKIPDIFAASLKL